MAADFVDRGRSLVAAGQHQEAVKVCRLGLLAHPTDLAGRLVLASALLALQRFDEVLAEMRVALEIDQSSSEGLRIKGEALLRKGDGMRAAEVLNQAAQLSPGDAQIEALLAQTRAPTAEPNDSTAVTHRSDFPIAEPSSVAEESQDEIELSGADLLPVTPAPELGVAQPVAKKVDPLGVTMKAAPLEPPAPGRTTMLGHEAAVAPEVFAAAPVSAPDAATMALSPAAPAPQVPPAMPIPAQVEEKDLEASGDAALAIFGEQEAADDVPIGTPGGSPANAHTLAEPQPAAGPGDMRTIRQGLGLSPDPTQANLPRPELPASPPAAEKPEGSDGKASKRKPKSAKKSAARRRAAAAKRSRRSRLSVLIYSLVGLLVVAGAVFAGFKVREIRLEQQIRFALNDGAKKAAIDTYAGHLRALESFESILKVKPTPEALAARALVSAQLVSEFGWDVEKAQAAIQAAGQAQLFKAAAAGLHLALGRGDLEEAKKLIETIASQYPRESVAIAYLRGLIALEDGDFETAARELEAALAERRPMAYVRLAEAQLELGRFDAALAAVGTAFDQVERHPAAMIVRARILVRAGRLDEGNSAAEMVEVMKEGGRELSNQNLGVSRHQVAWAALALAEVELASGRIGESKVALERASSSRGRSTDLRFVDALVTGLIAVGEIGKAELEVDLVQKNHPERRLTHIMTARLALARGRDGEAAAALEKAGELGSYPVALSLRGWARLGMSEPDAAIADFDAALEMVPSLRTATLGRAKADLQLGDGKAAKRRLEVLFDDIEKADPEVTEAYGVAVARSGDVDRARSMLKELSARTDRASSFAALAQIELIGGDSKAARAAFEKAVEIDSSYAEAVIGLAGLYVDAGKYKQAGKLLAGVSGPTAKSALVLAHRARVAVLTGQHDEAKSLLDDARASGGAPALVAREAGRLALRSGDTKTAVLRLQEATSKAKTDLEGRLLLLSAVMAASSSGKARKPNLDDVIRDFEKDFAGAPEVNLARGMAAVGSRQAKEAIQSLEAANMRMGESGGSRRYRAEVSFYLGRAHYIAGDLKKAEASLRAALKRNPHHADAYFFLGQIYFESEKFEPARAAYTKALELDPAGNPRAWFFLADVSGVLGKSDEAKKAAKEYLERFPSGPDAPAVKKMLDKL